MPFALLVPSDWRHPLETIDTGVAYPGLVTYITSGGTESLDWYLHPQVDHVYQGGWPRLGPQSRPNRLSPCVAAWRSSLVPVAPGLSVAMPTIDWNAVTTPLVTWPGYSLKDPALTWHDGWFQLVASVFDEHNHSRLGARRSRDLATWEGPLVDHWRGGRRLVQPRHPDSRRSFHHDLPELGRDPAAREQESAVVRRVGRRRGME